jgi:thiol-disulfide isomerase/thioredoxin
MSFRPIQRDVDYEIPDEKSQAACKVTVVRDGKASGWVVVGPAGQMLRRFMDTNGDNVVDQWSYYKNGLEVYRDIDSNNNNKVDQSRWMNTGGMRWGLDPNEDGKIDRWKMISAEEVSRVVVKALVTQDAAVIAPLLISREDLQELGLTGELQQKILKSVADPATRLRAAAAGSRMIHPKTTWMRFDGSTPSVIPADQFKTHTDLFVYENVMAIVDTGSKMPGLIQVGELIKVGDGWKLTRFPKPLEGANPAIELGFLQDPSATMTASAGAPDVPMGVSPDVQKLLEEIQEHDKNAPSPDASRAVIARFNKERADLIDKLRNAVDSDEEREQWTQQLADFITASIQVQAFPEGVERLKALEAEVKQKSPKSQLVSYIAYRRMLGAYAEEIQHAENDQRQKIQDRWLTNLEEFVTSYPTGHDAPDAILQLAMTHEFNGKLDKAKKWYQQIVSEYPKAQAAIRAGGALKRIDLTGKSLAISGPALGQKGTLDLKQFRGKTVLVLFWATWCKPCTEDLPQLETLYAGHGRQKFEILGINLDANVADVQPYLTRHNVPWSQIYEEGGLESPLAREFGIISLPTMFLVDAEGKVTNRSASVADVKELLEPEAKKTGSKPE